MLLTLSWPQGSAGCRGVRGAVGCRGFFGGGASAARIFPRSCCFPRCEIAIPLLQLPGRVRGFLAVPQPVLLQVCGGESHALAAPQTGQEHHPSCWACDTPGGRSVLPSAFGHHICNPRQSWCSPGVWVPSPSRPCCSCAALLPAGAGQRLEAGEELVVCSGHTKAAVAGLQPHHCRASPLPWQCSKLSPAGGRGWRNGEEAECRCFISTILRAAAGKVLEAGRVWPLGCTGWAQGSQGWVLITTPLCSQH